MIEQPTKLVQIEAGHYSFWNGKTSQTSMSHTIFGLNEDGSVWFFSRGDAKWIRIEQLARHKDEFDIYTNSYKRHGHKGDKIHRRSFF